MSPPRRPQGHGAGPGPSDGWTVDVDPARVEGLYRETLAGVHRQGDRAFARVMVAQWVFGVSLAWLSGFDGTPRSPGAGAVALGTLVSLAAVLAARRHAGRPWTRHGIAAGQMLWSVLIIHLAQGRVEAHFHVFGGLALLAWYRDARVLLTATAVVAVGHLAASVQPASVLGLLEPHPLRSIEHVAWIAFVDVGLLFAIRAQHREMRALAFRQAEAEALGQRTESEVVRRTQELEASREQYRTLVETTHSVPWQLDYESWEFVYVGPQAGELLGCAPADWLEAGFWHDRVHPEDRVRVEGHYCRAIETGTHVQVEFRMHRGDGDWAWVRGVASPSVEAGRHTLNGFMLDVTERRLSEERLASTQRRLEWVLASSTAILYQLHVAGVESRLEWMTDNVRRILGYDVEEALAPGWWFHNVHPEDKARVLRAPEHLSRDRTIEYRLRNKAGVYRWIRDDQRVVRDADGVPVQIVGAFSDITDNRRLESELHQAQKLESVGRLASGIAHEINTPVQFVTDSVFFVREAFDGLAPLRGRYRAELERAAGRDPLAAEAFRVLQGVEEELDVAYMEEQVPRALERSLEGLERVAVIVRSMKEFAHPDRKEMAEADLNHALTTTLTIARNEYKYVADVETDFGEIPLVRCHVNELNQVFLNLVVNAAHAIADRLAGGEGRGRIRIATRAEDGWVRISVSDDGCGIPESLHTTIFDPFFTTKGPGRGTGQGLAIARGVVVDQHGGRLTFDSTVGDGTTFHVLLPVDGGASGSHPEVAA